MSTNCYFVNWDQESKFKFLQMLQNHKDPIQIKQETIQVTQEIEVQPVKALVLSQKEFQLLKPRQFVDQEIYNSQQNEPHTQILSQTVQTQKQKIRILGNKSQVIDQDSTHMQMKQTQQTQDCSQQQQKKRYIKKTPQIESSKSQQSDNLLSLIKQNSSSNIIDLDITFKTKQNQILAKIYTLIFDQLHLLYLYVEQDQSHTNLESCFQFLVSLSDQLKIQPQKILLDEKLEQEVNLLKTKISVFISTNQQLKSDRSKQYNVDLVQYIFEMLTILFERDSIKKFVHILLQIDHLLQLIKGLQKQDQQ